MNNINNNIIINIKIIRNVNFQLYPFNYNILELIKTYDVFYISRLRKYFSSIK